MKDVISEDKGQLILLTGFLIVLEIVIFIALLNNMIYASNMPSTGLDTSKKDIREARTITEYDIKQAVLYANSNVSDPSNETQVKEYFLNYMNLYNENLKKIYGTRGASVEVVLNNVTFNSTKVELGVKKFGVIPEPNTFETGSLIIPMDGNQAQLIRVYGLMYKIVDGSGSSGLNSTSIRVWELMQNAVNGSVANFSSTINTDNDPSAIIGTVAPRSYSGGPFLVDMTDMDNTQRQMILTEAASKGITVHELTQDFYYSNSIRMEAPPRIAVYPKGDTMTIYVMEPYYQHSGVPYTLVNNTDILNGKLSNFDILTIPHHDMNNEPRNVILAITGWIANGGVTHIECMGTDTMDDSVERWAGSAKPWYGFIGVSKSRNLPRASNINSAPTKDGTYMKFLDSNTRFNAFYTFNTNPPMPLAGLADPGAPFNTLAQHDNTSGIFGPEFKTNGDPFIAATTAFSLRRTAGQVNPDTNILAYSSYGNGSPLYGDYNSDSIKEPQLLYVTAPYDNGMVIYVAGHDLTMRNPSAERLIFESFFTATMRQTQTTIVSAKAVNVTIRYSDGNVKYEDTFLISFIKKL